MTVAAPTARVDLALGGSYRAEVDDDDPLGWWRLADAPGSAEARDESGNARPGTNEGDIAFQVQTDVAESGFAYSFDGSTAYVTMGDIAAFEFLAAYAVEFWIKKASNPGAEMRLVGKADATTGWRVNLTTGGAIRFVHRNAAGSGDAWNLSAGSVCDGEWHHVVCTWDGTTDADGVKVYVDGSATSATAATASLSATNSAFVVAASATPDQYFDATLDEVAVYGANLSAARVSAHYLAGLWTDVTADVLAPPGLLISYGINGNGPTDRLADPGLCEFWFNNSDRNSAGLLGYYSPNHDDVRAGFTFGIMCRVTFIFGGTEYPGFMGRIEHIHPEPGVYRSRRTRVVCNDLMQDLSSVNLRNVTLQSSQTETQLFETLIDALPVTARPLALDFDDAKETILYAFDKLGGGEKAIAPLSDLQRSTLGYWYYDRNGAARYENRYARQTVPTSYTFENDMVELRVPSSLEGVFNHFRLTLHPKRVDAAATTVLWAQTGAAPGLMPGFVTNIWGTYYKTSEPEVKIGGTERVAPQATTDYTGNTAADGSGTDKTAQLSVVATFFSTTVLFEITNNDAGTVYLTKLQCRGKGLYDESPQTVEAVSAEPYGSRPNNIDLPYQASLITTQDLADYLLAQYKNEENQADELLFSARRSTAFMEAALGSEIGKRIALTETVSGLLGGAFFIQRITLSAPQLSFLKCAFGLSPSIFGVGPFWILEEAGSELGVNTVLGFG